jgi:hypothetical protein
MTSRANRHRSTLSAKRSLVRGAVAHGVLVRELDAGRAVRILDHDRAAPLRVPFLALETHNGVFAKAGALPGLLNGPLQHRARGPALSWRNHTDILHRLKLVTAISKAQVPFIDKNGDIIFIDGDKRTTKHLTDLSMVLKSPPSNHFQD